MEQLVIFIILLIVGFSAGTIAEKRHYRSIRKREEKFLKLPAVNIKQAFDPAEVEKGWMVTGSVVVSIDYFKKFLAGLKGLFGGRIGAYETLVDRGRREAVLRMKQMAHDADMIVNLRIETSSISSNAAKKNAVGTIEVLAYGTAIRLNRRS